MPADRPVAVPDFVAVVGVEVVQAALDRPCPIPQAVFLEPAPKTSPEEGNR